MKNIFPVFLVLCLHFSASGSDCDHSRDMDQILADFHLEISVLDAEGKDVWTAASRDQVCAEKSIPLQIAQSLIDLKNLPPFSDLGGDYETGILGNSAYQYLKERVSVVRIDDRPKSRNCQSHVSGTLAYVLDSGSNTIYICPFATRFSSIQLHGTLIHEARHLLQNEKYGDEKAQYVKTGQKTPSFNSHTPCEHGFLIGTMGCDPHPNTKGAYAVETEFFLKISKSERLPESVRAKARGLALDMLLGHFNNIPAGAHGILLVSEAGDLQFYNPGLNTVDEVMNSIPNHMVVTDRFTPTLFDPLTGTVKSLASIPQILVDTPGEFAQEFRDLHFEQQRNLVDVVYGVRIQCWLFQTELLCTNGREKITIALPSPIRNFHFSVLRGTTPHDLIFISTDSGQHFRLPTERKIDTWTLAEIVKEDLLHLKDYRQVGLLPGLKRYALNLNGELVTYEDPQAPSLVSGTRGIRFKKMIAPFLWTNEFQNF